MKRTIVLALTCGLLAACAEATRTPPGPDDIAKVKDLFGLTEALDVTLDRGLAPLAGRATVTQRQCVRTQLQGAITPLIDQQLGAMFETRENIKAWSDFNVTGEGRKLLGAFRERTLAHASGGTAPTLEDVAAQLSEGERERAEDFFQSDAGQILKKPFPSGETLLAPVQPQFPAMARTCGLIR